MSHFRLPCKPVEDFNFALPNMDILKDQKLNKITGNSNTISHYYNNEFCTGFVLPKEYIFFSSTRFHVSLYTFMRN